MDSHMLLPRWVPSPENSRSLLCWNPDESQDPGNHLLVQVLYVVFFSSSCVFCFLLALSYFLT